MKHICVNIIAFFILALQMQAQYYFQNYKHLNQTNGLPGYYVGDFAEDNHGFIWMATSNGVVRYDGSKVISLEKTEGDSVYLPSQEIYSLLIRGDSLWIGTQKGLSILNLSTERLSNHELKSVHLELSDGERQKVRIRDIYEDRNGNIWLAPNYGGFVKWDKQTNDFISFPIYPTDTLPNSYRVQEQTSLGQIIQDVKKDHIMWGCSMSGLIRLDTETGEIHRILYKEGGGKTQFNVNRKICLFQNSDGRIFSGSWHSGLSIYDPATGRYHYPHVDLSDADEPFTSHHLYNIVKGDSQILYLTYSVGLASYNPNTQEARILKRNITKSDPLEFGIDFIDSQNRLWNGSGTGVVVSDPVVQQFRRYSLEPLNPTDTEVLIRGIVEDFYPGYLSFCGQYTDGLYHFNPTTGHMFKQIHPEYMAQRPAFFAWGLTQLDENTLLVAEGQKLFKYQKGVDRLEYFDIQPPVEHSYYHNILAGRDGNIWIGTKNDGLFSINTKTNVVNSYEASIPSPQVYGQFEDSKGNVWMIMEKGHLVYSRTDRKIHVFDFNKDTTTSFREVGGFCECPNGELWMAGNNEGLAKISGTQPDEGIIKKIIIKNKEGETVKPSKIACDQNNVLWISGGSSLLKLNREDWSAESFSFDYGINDYSGMFQFLKTGELFISSRDGFYTVDPNKVSINRILPRPYVVSVISNNGPENKISDHLSGLPIVLEPRENVITITFSAINHTLSERTRFLYMLEGVDKNWIDPEDKRTLTYAYLEGGDYTFKIKAANNEGFWNPEIYELPIMVGTPWYKTALFWIILSGMLAAFIYAYYKDRLRQVEKESRLKADFDRQVADLEMRALRAQMNPHFIFNCLNSIDAYIIKNDTRKASEYLNHFSRLVRLILQHSRSAYVNLKDELESLELYIKLEQMRFRNAFEYEIVLKDYLVAENYEIPPMLIQPFVENAIWHGLNYKETGGKVKVEVEESEDMLICVIEDNGIGRKAAAAIRASKKIKRKSMGMGITAERIEIINNLYQTHNHVEIEDLYDESGNASGTRVRLHIPL